MSQALILRKNEILTLDQLPAAVHATAPAADVSSRYTFINTMDVVAQMMDSGLVPVRKHVYNKRVSRAGAQETAFHMVAFQPKSYAEGDFNAPVGGVVPEVRMYNSHDRTSRFGLELGLFRKVCSNGMIVRENGASVSFRHMQNEVFDAGIIAKQMLDKFQGQFDVIERMVKRVLTPVEALDYANAVTVALPWSQHRTVQAEALLEVRRPEDKASNLWSVMNRVQENYIKGGPQVADSRGYMRTLRPITSIMADRAINHAVWDMANQVLEVSK